MKKEKKNINKLVKRQQELVTMLTGDQLDYLDMLDEFCEISMQLKGGK
jgi:hypothetical protein